MSEKLRVAVEGCGHGTLHAIYDAVAKDCQSKGWDGVDLLIIGGDFQAVRNNLDLNCMAVPVKYREIGDFHEYYSGQRLAPYLTIFVGGNHEASNHLWELYYGGWVAPNIYYMGAANVLRLGPLRIAGISGIWKGYNYRKPHFERLPYNEDDIRSIYHVREMEVRKLKQIKTQVDIGISHDWPKGIEWLGDHKWLFMKKDLFEADARAGKLGSVAAQQVLDHLRPPHWFSAHLHIRYTATVDHAKHDEHKKIPTEPETKSDQPNQQAVAHLDGTKDQKKDSDPVHNADELDLDLHDDDAEQIASKPIQNQDEIDLDMEDHENTNDTKPSSYIDSQGKKSLAQQYPSDPPTSNTPATTETISDDIRAQLPASFTKPAPAPKEPDPPTSIHNTITNFLALDKCLPNRHFLELLEIHATPTSSQSSPQLQPTNPLTPPKLTYDPEWLAITRAFALEHPLLLGNPHAPLPYDPGRAAYLPKIQAAAEWLQRNVLSSPEKLIVPHNFTITAPVFDPGMTHSPHEMPLEQANPQTQAFCDLLGIENAFASSEEERRERAMRAPAPSASVGRGRGGWRGGRGRGGRGGGGYRGLGFRARGR